MTSLWFDDVVFGYILQILIIHNQYCVCLQQLLLQMSSLNHL